MPLATWVIQRPSSMMRCLPQRSACEHPRRQSCGIRLGLKWLFRRLMLSTASLWLGYTERVVEGHVDIEMVSCATRWQAQVARTRLVARRRISAFGPSGWIWMLVAPIASRSSSRRCGLGAVRLPSVSSAEDPDVGWIV